MTQKTKTIGLLTILSLAMVAVAPSLIGDAQATRSNVGTVPPLNQEQIQEQTAKPAPEPPSLTLIQLEFTNGNSDETKPYTKGNVPADRNGIESFRTAFVVANQGSGEVRNIEVEIESDVETIKTELVGQLEAKSSVISTTIKAIDPNSITATIKGFEIVN